MMAMCEPCSLGPIYSRSSIPSFPDLRPEGFLDELGHQLNPDMHGGENLRAVFSVYLLQRILTS